MKIFTTILVLVAVTISTNAQTKPSSKNQYEISTEVDTLKDSQMEVYVYNELKRDYVIYGMNINGVRIRNTERIIPFIVKVTPNRKYDIICSAIEYEPVVLPPISVVKGQKTIIKIYLKPDGKEFH